jgi:predicted ATPase/class 3 adenylate cyclase
MALLPTGTVTFLFTDVEDSTRLLQELAAGYEVVEVQHAEILRRAIVEGGGTEVSTEGDSFFAVFPRPTGALHAAVAAQRALAKEHWPEGITVRVRMGMHTGEGRTGGPGSAADYIGMDVNRAARIAAAANGGQVLLSDATRGLVEHALPKGVRIRELGKHRLKDIEYPERLYDLVIDGLPADFPPIRTLEVPTNVPAERTSFIGRERELAEVTALLEQARFLTLTGPGGSGKSRLALRVASAQFSRFPQGVYWVDLSAITNPTLVLSAIASALRIRDEPGRNPLETLVDRLRDRQMLLVVDSFEHVAEGASVIGRLLDAASGLTVLATSRVPLRVVGEREYDVSPLAVPDRGSDIEAIAACEAVRLFTDRALAVRPSFQLTPQNATAVAEITARLDGLPLAIELAASRLNLLDPRSMLTRLDKRLPLLTGRVRDVPERQRTLRSTIDWSHDHLSPDERRLFARVSVFAGEWSLEAADAVCGPGLDSDFLEGLSGLVDASLVRRREPGDGVVRFRMLETIREYAAETLAGSGEEDDVRRRHAEHLRDVAEEAESHLTGDGLDRWLTRLEAERDNIRAALDWASESGEAETALRTAAAMWRFWQHRGLLAEGRRRLEVMLALPAAQTRNALRARALSALGGIAYWQGDYRPMRTAYEEAVEIAQDTGDSRLLARALLDLSFAAMVDTNLDEQEELLRAAFAEAEGGDPAVTAQILIPLAFIELQRRNPAVALKHVERALAIHRELGNRMAGADSLCSLATLRLLIGETEPAKEQLREAAALMAQTESRMFLSTMLLPLAFVETLDGQYRRAARLIGSSVRQGEELGGGAPSFVVLPLLGDPQADARRALGDEEYEREWAQGYAMSLDDAVAFVVAGSK